MTALHRARNLPSARPLATLLHLPPDPTLDPAPSLDGVAVLLPPAVPVLPGTLLGLELMLQRPSLDLRAFRDLLCEDPCALLHLYAALHEDLPDATASTTRLEDSISSISADLLLRNLAQAGSTRRDHLALARFAQHSAAIGRYAQAVADSLGLPREHALLVGTLHELGTLPALLGWPTASFREADPATLAEQLCRRFHLPLSLRTSLDAVHRNQPGSVWVAVLAAAHDLLNAS